MRGVRPACGAEALCLLQASGKVVVLGGTGKAGEGRIAQRRVIWLCDACTDLSAVETWRAHGRPERPSRSFPKCERVAMEARS